MNLIDELASLIPSDEEIIRLDAERRAREESNDD